MEERGFWRFFTAFAVAAVVVVTMAARSEPSPRLLSDGADPGLGGASTTATTAAPEVVPDLTVAASVPEVGRGVDGAAVPTTAGAFVPTDDRLLVFGDSVILGTEVALPGALTGWDVDLDAEVSRFSTQLAAEVERRRGTLGQAVVVQVGNNYFEGRTTFAAQLERILTSLRGVPRVVLLTVAEARDGRDEVNAEVRAAASRHANVVVADWQQLWSTTSGLTGSDGLHLTRRGAEAMVGLISQALGPPPTAQ